jgi:uncharacterized protein YunC (DUF1805 family)
MITTSLVTIGGHGMEGASITTQNNCVLVIQAPKGLLACKYISVERANQMLDCVAIVKNVETLNEMLGAEVIAISNAAQKKGIEPGMTGEEALLKML